MIERMIRGPVARRVDLSQAVRDFSELVGDAPTAGEVSRVRAFLRKKRWRRVEELASAGKVGGYSSTRAALLACLALMQDERPQELLLRFLSLLTNNTFALPAGPALWSPSTLAGEVRYAAVCGLRPVYGSWLAFALPPRILIPRVALTVLAMAEKAPALEGDAALAFAVATSLFLTLLPGEVPSREVMAGPRKGTPMQRDADSEVFMKDQAVDRKRKAEAPPGENYEQRLWKMLRSDHPEIALEQDVEIGESSTQWIYEDPQPSSDPRWDGDTSQQYRSPLPDDAASTDNGALSKGNTQRKKRRHGPSLIFKNVRRGVNLYELPLRKLRLRDVEEVRQIVPILRLSLSRAAIAPHPHLDANDTARLEENIETVLEKEQKDQSLELETPPTPSDAKQPATPVEEPPSEQDKVDAAKSQLAEMITLALGVENRINRDSRLRGGLGPGYEIANALKQRRETISQTSADRPIFRTAEFYQDLTEKLKLAIDDAENLFLITGMITELKFGQTFKLPLDENEFALVVRRIGEVFTKWTRRLNLPAYDVGNVVTLEDISTAIDALQRQMETKRIEILEQIANDKIKNAVGRYRLKYTNARVLEQNLSADDVGVRYTELLDAITRAQKEEDYARKSAETLQVSAATDTDVDTVFTQRLEALKLGIQSADRDGDWNGNRRRQVVNYATRLTHFRDNLVALRILYDKAENFDTIRNSILTSLRDQNLDLFVSDTAHTPLFQAWTQQIDRAVENEKVQASFNALKARINGLLRSNDFPSDARNTKGYLESILAYENAKSVEVVSAVENAVDDAAMRLDFIRRALKLKRPTPDPFEEFGFNGQVDVYVKKVDEKQKNFEIGPNFEKLEEIRDRLQERESIENEGWPNIVTSTPTAQKKFRLRFRTPFAPEVDALVGVRQKVIERAQNDAANLLGQLKNLKSIDRDVVIDAIGLDGRIRNSAENGDIVLADNIEQHKNDFEAIQKAAGAAETADVKHLKNLIADLAAAVTYAKENTFGRADALISEVVGKLSTILDPTRRETLQTTINESKEAIGKERTRLNDAQLKDARLRLRDLEEELGKVKLATPQEAEFLSHLIRSKGEIIAFQEQNANPNVSDIDAIVERGYGLLKTINDRRHTREYDARVGLNVALAYLQQKTTYGPLDDLENAIEAYGVAVNNATDTAGDLLADEINDYQVDFEKVQTVFVKTLKPADARLGQILANISRSTIEALEHDLEELQALKKSLPPNNFVRDRVPTVLKDVQGQLIVLLEKQQREKLERLDKLEKQANLLLPTTNFTGDKERSLEAFGALIDAARREGIDADRYEMLLRQVKGMWEVLERTSAVSIDASRIAGDAKPFVTPAAASSGQSTSQQLQEEQRGLGIVDILSKGVDAAKNAMVWVGEKTGITGGVRRVVKTAKAVPGAVKSAAVFVLSSLPEVVQQFIGFKTREAVQAVAEADKVVTEAEVKTKERIVKLLAQLERERKDELARRLRAGEVPVGAAPETAEPPPALRTPEQIAAAREMAQFMHEEPLWYDVYEKWKLHWRRCVNGHRFLEIDNVGAWACRQHALPLDRATQRFPCCDKAAHDAGCVRADHRVTEDPLTDAHDICGVKPLILRAMRGERPGAGAARGDFVRFDKAEHARRARPTTTWRTAAKKKTVSVLLPDVLEVERNPADANSLLLDAAQRRDLLLWDWTDRAPVTARIIYLDQLSQFIFRQTKDTVTLKVGLIVEDVPVLHQHGRRGVPYRRHPNEKLEFTPLERVRLWESSRR